MSEILPIEKSIVMNVRVDHSKKWGHDASPAEGSTCKKKVRVRTGYDEVVLLETRESDYTCVSVSGRAELLRAADEINAGMTWATTPEGSAFWDDICTRLRRIADKCPADY